MKLVDNLVHLERTTSLDAGFLALEGPATPMHIGSLTYLEAGPLHDRQGRIRLGDLRRLVEERLSLAPRFRQRPVTGPLGLGRPLWVDDPHFEVANHVNEVVLPPPGSEQQLLELAAQLMMRLLDRSRPLWELWVVDALADGNVALVEKVHHVMMDGVSGVDVVMLLTDDNLAEGRRGGRAGTPAAPKARAGRHGTLPLLAAGAADELGVPLALAGMPFRLARLAAGALRQPARHPDLEDRVAHVGALASGSLSLLSRSVIAPRTALNEPVTNVRTYVHVEWPLAGAQAIGHSFDCTLNDVLLAAVTGGVRQLLLSREEDPGERFQVAVPVSTRRAAEHLALGNRVALFLVPLPVALEDAVVQLETVHQLTRQRKEGGQAAAIAALVSAADHWPTPVIGLIARLAHHQPFANAVVTNVPGPPRRRYLMGARVRRLAPVVPLAGNLDLSICMLSYDGELSFGCLADAERVPDVRVVGEGIRATLESLEVAASKPKGVVP